MRGVIGVLAALLLLPLPARAAQEIQGIDGERVFMVNSYRYQPGDSGGDPDTGHALCGNRCYALSVDYRNLLEPMGWRIIKVASDKEVTVDLENPFIGGQCVCIADEFVIQLNEFNWQSRQPGREK